MQVIEPDESSTGPNVFGDSVDWEIHPHFAKLCRKATVQSHSFSTFSEFPLKLGTILGVIRSGTKLLLFLFMGLSFHNLSQEKTEKEFRFPSLRIVKMASEKFHLAKESPTDPPSESRTERPILASSLFFCFCLTAAERWLCRSYCH